MPPSAPSGKPTRPAVLLAATKHGQLRVSSFIVVAGWGVGVPRPGVQYSQLVFSRQGRTQGDALEFLVGEVEAAMVPASVATLMTRPNPS